jgi:predicted acyltransferase
VSIPSKISRDRIKSQRFVSLDVFRGIAIAFMILVNSQGNWDYIYGELNGSLLFAIAMVLFCWVVLYVMYRRRWFFKI